jgi:hypothetical protein
VLFKTTGQYIPLLLLLVEQCYHGDVGDTSEYPPILCLCPTVSFVSFVSPVLLNNIFKLKKEKKKPCSNCTTKLKKHH